VTITDNTNAPVTADSANFSMTYVDAAFAPADATGHYHIAHNTIQGRNGIGIYTGFPGLGDAAYRDGVDIEGNRITATIPGGNAISVTNASAASDGGAADIDGLRITGNTLLGAGGNGVSVSGRITSPQITGNDVRGYDTGIRLMTSSAGNSATDVDATRNRLVDNTAAGVSSTLPGTVDATANWWGCNAGPGNPGCDAVAGTGTVDASPNLVLGISADPGAVAADGSSVVTADIGHDSDGNARDVFPDGTSLAFAATGGTVAPATTSLTGGTASTTFTSGGFEGRSVSTTVDHQTVTVTFADLDHTPPETTITSDVGTKVFEPSHAFTFTSSEAGSTFQCRLNDGPWEACSSPKTETFPARGHYTFAVRAIDPSGNVDPTPATQSFDYHPCYIVTVQLTLLGAPKPLTICI
jgi:hypothetical protein